MATRLEYRNHVIEIRQEEGPVSRPWRPSFQTVYDIFRRAGGSLLPVLVGFEQGRSDQALLAARLKARVDVMLSEEAMRPGMLRNRGTTQNGTSVPLTSRRSLPYNGR